MYFRKFGTEVRIANLTNFIAGNRTFKQIIITWHSLGSSLTAFSTAKLRDAVDLEISTRQFGQVAT